MSRHAAKRTVSTQTVCIVLMLFLVAIAMLFINITTLLHTDSIRLSTAYTSAIGVGGNQSEQLSSFKPDDVDDRVYDYQPQQCRWNAPWTLLPRHSFYHASFREARFDHGDTMDYIQAKVASNACSQTATDYVWNFNTNRKGPNIAVICLALLRNHTSDEPGIGIDIFSDIRSYHLKIANALRYCEQNGYTFILQYAPIFEYQSVSNESKYVQEMSSAGYQKPFILHKYIRFYDWLFYIDYDTVFVNCQHKIEDVIIEQAYKLHQGHATKQDISLIFGGEQWATINNGIFALKNNEWSDRFLDNWMFLTEHAEKFRILDIEDTHHDQKLFVALLQGFDPRKELDNQRNYKLIERLRDSTLYSHILKRDGLQRSRSPIYNETLAKYAVVTNESIINAKSYWFTNKKRTKEERSDALLVHFYFLTKQSPTAVFPTFKYAMKQCA